MQAFTFIRDRIKWTKSLLYLNEFVVKIEKDFFFYRRVPNGFSSKLLVNGYAGTRLGKYLHVSDKLPIMYSNDMIWFL